MVMLTKQKDPLVTQEYQDSPSSSPLQESTVLSISVFNPINQESILFHITSMVKDLAAQLPIFKMPCSTYAEAHVTIQQEDGS